MWIASDKALTLVKYGSRTTSTIGHLERETKEIAKEYKNQVDQQEAGVDALLSKDHLGDPRELPINNSQDKCLPETPDPRLDHLMELLMTSGDRDEAWLQNVQEVVTDLKTKPRLELYNTPDEIERMLMKRRKPPPPVNKKP